MAGINFTAIMMSRNEILRIALSFKVTANIQFIEWLDLVLQLYSFFVTKNMYELNCT